MRQEAVIGVGIRRLELTYPISLIISGQIPQIDHTNKDEELINLWATRTCTPEGNIASEVIVILEYEVQNLVSATRKRLLTRKTAPPVTENFH